MLWIALNATAFIIITTKLFRNEIVYNSINVKCIVFKRKLPASRRYRKRWWQYQHCWCQRIGKHCHCFRCKLYRHRHRCYCYCCCRCRLHPTTLAWCWSAVQGLCSPNPSNPFCWLACDVMISKQQRKSAFLLAQGYRTILWANISKISLATSHLGRSNKFTLSIFLFYSRFGSRALRSNDRLIYLYLQRIAYSIRSFWTCATKIFCLLECLFLHCSFFVWFSVKIHRKYKFV